MKMPYIREKNIEISYTRNKILLVIVYQRVFNFLYLYIFTVCKNNSKFIVPRDSKHFPQVAIGNS